MKGGMMWKPPHIDGINSHKCLSRNHLFFTTVATPIDSSYASKRERPGFKSWTHRNCWGLKKAATLRRSGITRGRTSAEIVGLGTQRTWKTCEPLADVKGYSFKTSKRVMKGGGDEGTTAYRGDKFPHVSVKEPPFHTVMFFELGIVKASTRPAPS